MCTNGPSGNGVAVGAGVLVGSIVSVGMTVAAAVIATVGDGVAVAAVAGVIKFGVARTVPVGGGRVSAAVTIGSVGGSVTLSGVCAQATETNAAIIQTTTTSVATDRLRLASVRILRKVGGDEAV